MAKLGKKARKFARKNLQSVLKKKRKFKSMRESSRRKQSSNNGEQVEGNNEVINSQLTNRDHENLNGAFAGNFLDALVSDDDDGNLVEDASESDGFLSEDPDCPYVSEPEQNGELEVEKKREIHLELVRQKKKMERLRKKDPDFAVFLENHGHHLRELSERTSSDEEGVNDKDITTYSRDLKPLYKVLNTHTIDVWCWMVMEQADKLALPNLLNAFRAACHFGIYNSNESSWKEIPNREVCSKVLMFVLCEADGIFRRLLGISDAFCKDIFKMEKNLEWRIARSLIKSYLRSSLFLLNQLTDNQILTFILSRLRVSILFFAGFPSLLRRLVKIAVHLWATGDNSLSLSAFLLIQEIATVSSCEYLGFCLIKVYNAFVSHCKYIESSNLKHVEFLSDCLVELHTLNVQQSYEKAFNTLQQLAKVLQCAFRTKMKNELQRICSWQYVSCIDFWVKFISRHISDHEVQPLVYMVIQIMMGTAHLFTGRRYLPLRIKCVQMLNQLSRASGIFIPVVSLVLDSLEYEGIGSGDPMRGKACSFASLLKVPKQLLKSKEFQEECTFAALEQLSAHISQWSYNISFPELATIPLTVLKKFHEKTTTERLRHLVRRLIEQVERHNDFVQRKRDEVAFSPSDQSSVDLFLQLEKSRGGVPFTGHFTDSQRNASSGKLAER